MANTRSPAFRHTNRIAAALLSGIGVAGAVSGYGMGLWTAGSPAAGLLPFSASVLLAVLAGAAALAGYSEGSEPQPSDAATRMRLLSYLAAIALFCVGPLVAGSLSGFAVALFVALRVGERLPLAASLVWSVGLSAGSIGLFRLVLDVPLPDPLIDRLLGL